MISLFWGYKWLFSMSSAAFCMRPFPLEFVIFGVFGCLSVVALPKLFYAKFVVNSLALYVLSGIIVGAFPHS